eukprot:CAMPEP_0168315192 /NCGR_PEP_ID=MMETSP0210-20121227/10421_1 /TAXON_ID=40633 /ORGANISM="Condylostoma magnum, Strain COL2" /LENGTH=39 /DNA_ID= /DNA_START= /DNA_END= /DNA_ORIENTATION=
MSSPNPDDPLDNGIAEHWISNEASALNQAREWTALYANE